MSARPSDIFPATSTRQVYSMLGSIQESEDLIVPLKTAVLDVVSGTKKRIRLVLSEPTDTKDAMVLKFNRLARRWRNETGHISLISKRIQHPAFLQILEMGGSAVPLIIKEMEQRPDHWFYALAYLTGENPVPRDFSGTVEDAADLWIRWGHSRYAD